MVPKKKVVIVCDKNSRTSFGRLTLDLEHTLFADFDVSILWLKTPKYFPDDDKALPEERGTKSSSIWAKSLHMGFYKFREPFVEYFHSPGTRLFGASRQKGLPEVENGRADP